MRSLIRRVFCLFGRHQHRLHEISAGGVLTVVPRCSCGHVDVDRIQQVRWNRADRRSWSRRLKLR